MLRCSNGGREGQIGEGHHPHARGALGQIGLLWLELLRGGVGSIQVKLGDESLALEELVPSLELKERR